MLFEVKGGSREGEELTIGEADGKFVVYLFEG